MKPVIIYGNNPIAKRVFFESRQNGSDFQIAAFCAGDNFLNGEASFCDLPLVPESEVIQKYPPSEYDMLSCVDAPSRLRNRLLVYDKLKNMGYFLRNFISPLAYVSDKVQVGENNIIFAFAQILNDTCLGHSNTIRGMAHIAHDVIIGNGTNVGVSTIIGGFANIGNSCWLGLNCTINNSLIIADETLAGSGAVIIRNTNPGTTYIGNPARACSTHLDTGICLNIREANSLVL